jgi:hypothetical protein
VTQNLPTLDKNRENSLFDTTLNFNSLFDTEKLFSSLFDITCKFLSLYDTAIHSVSLYRHFYFSLTKLPFSQSTFNHEKKNRELAPSRVIERCKVIGGS